MNEKLQITNEWDKVFPIYILEDYLMTNLANVIEINHEIIDVEYREEKKALTIRNKNVTATRNERFSIYFFVSINFP